MWLAVGLPEPTPPPPAPNLDQELDQIRGETPIFKDSEGFLSAFQFPPIKHELFLEKLLSLSLALYEYVSFPRFS